MLRPGRASLKMSKVTRQGQRVLHRRIAEEGEYFPGPRGLTNVR